MFNIESIITGQFTVLILLAIMGVSLLCGVMLALVYMFVNKRRLLQRTCRVACDSSCYYRRYSSACEQKLGGCAHTQRRIRNHQIQNNTKQP